MNTITENNILTKNASCSPLPVLRLRVGCRARFSLLFDHHILYMGGGCQLPICKWCSLQNRMSSERSCWCLEVGKGNRMLLFGRDLLDWLFPLADSSEMLSIFRYPRECWGWAVCRAGRKSLHCALLRPQLGEQDASFSRLLVPRSRVGCRARCFTFSLI